MKKTIAVALFALLILSGCAAQTHEPPATARYVDFAQVADWAKPESPTGFTKVLAEQEAKAEPAVESYEPEYVEPYYAPTYDEPTYDNGDGFMSQGRRYYNGGTETWYTSDEPYDIQDRWTVDDEGYYRDEDGYYVVASDDAADGEVIDTSKGEAKVYDHGSGYGNTDFYTDF